jgi:hypothetical protein
MERLDLKPGTLTEDTEVDMLTIGDEQSDFGLGQVAIRLNTFERMSGHFAIVYNMREGGDKLREAITDFARALGKGQEIWVVKSVKEDGACDAIEKWLNL